MRKHKWMLFILISFIVVQSCVSIIASASAGSSGDDWVMFRHDQNRSGYTASSGSTSSAQLLWTCMTGRMVRSSPSVANGCVVVGSRDSQVFCISASEGDPLWKYPIKNEVWSSPAVDNGRVYVGADDGYVYCLNLTSGKLLWRSAVGGQVRSSPTVVDGCVYIGSGVGDVCALNASDGAMLWRFRTSYRVDSSPAVSDGVVYVATDFYFFHALNASTGDEIWNRYTRSVFSSPCVYDGYVFVGSYDGYVCGLNASTGAEVWRYQTGGSVYSSPAVAYGCVYVGSDDNNVYCLDAESGKKVWQSSTGYCIRSSPAVADGNVYVGSEDYNIYCLNASTGEKKWTYETGNSVDSSPAVVDGCLYVGSDDFGVYAFALGDSAGSLPSQPANSLPWTTVAFDAIACAVMAAIAFSTVYFVRLNRAAKQKAENVKFSGWRFSWFSEHADAVCVLVILAFSALLFVNLGREPLWIADEQTYSQWAYHMVKTGDYLTPWANGELTFYIAKPPLMMWLMSLSYQVFGVNNFATRFWSPVFGMLSLVLVFFLGKQLYNRRVGLLAALVFGTFLTFYELSTHAMTDGPLVFFVLGSMYFLFLSESAAENSSRYLILGGLFFGLALMTKQIQALVIPLIGFFYFILTKKKVSFLWVKRFALFCGVGFLVFSPWLIYMVLRFGSDFWQVYFMYHGVSRVVGTIEEHAGGYLFYFNYLVSSENALWVVLLPFAVGLCAFNAVFKRSKGDTFILVWMTTVLALFTLAQTKINWYILPAFPAFAVAISNLLYQLLKRIQISIRQKTGKATTETSRNPDSPANL
jgi:outer membrane protein assembly factor BamB